MFGQSFFSVKRLAFIIGLIAILGIGATAIFAATGGTVTIAGGGSYNMTVTPNSDDGGGNDRLMTVCYNGATLADTDRVDRTTSGSPVSYSDFCGPHTLVCYYDISANIPENDFSTATMSQIFASPLLDSDGTGTCTGAAAASGTAGIFDGRINWPDLGASAAVYCHSGGYRVYEIGSDGRGTLVMELTAEAVTAAMTEAAGGANVLVETASDVQFWVLAPGNRLQIVSPEVNEAGKMYNFVGELIC